MIAGYDRLKGFKSGMAMHNLAIEDNLIACGDFTEDGGYAAMQKLLPLHPEAVFIASDTMSIGALRAIKEAGLHVPANIGIVSFDDMPFAAHTDPPLTSVRQPIQCFGEVAVQTLIDMIGHPDTGPRHIILPTQLIDRGSSGPRLLLSEKGG
jgi:LacI family transcriptional regulator